MPSAAEADPALAARLRAWREEQRELARTLVRADAFEGPDVIGGFDVAYDGDDAYGALVHLDARTLRPLATWSARVRVEVPYVSGYLSFREFPVARALLEPPGRRPDVLLVDGSGLLHPRRVGSAAHVGARLDLPTVGVTKRRLWGRPARELTGPGDAVPMVSNGEVLGHAFWSSPRATRPIYVSPGHRVGVESALALVRRLCVRRLPEPIRLADAQAALAKREGVERKKEGGPQREDAAEGSSSTA